MAKNLREVLREHWITSVNCDKQTGTNYATCACSAWRGRTHTSVRAAVDEWIEHVSGYLPGEPQAPQVPDGFILVPRQLTAENGAKGALSGEFYEDYGIQDERGNECLAKVAVNWTTIKEIHKAMVAHFDSTSTSSISRPNLCLPKDGDQK